MLEKPDIDELLILDCLLQAYGLHISGLTFLPLGADQDTAVYRASGTDGGDHFVKLRRGEFFPASVAVPNILYQSGARSVIPPVLTLDGRLCTRLEPYTVVVYPFIVGKNAFERELTVDQWKAFGAVLKQMHTTIVPSEIALSIRREDFSPRWRDTVRMFLQRICRQDFDEPAAAHLADFLKGHSAQTLDLVQTTERLAAQVQSKACDFVLCHGDIHGWNLLIRDDLQFYIVDWDTLVFAPKERDLMFIGSGFFGGARSCADEVDLFYAGYGQVEVDQTAIAYYRCERIIEDIAVFCNQLLLSDEGGEDRWQSLAYLKSNYLPGNTIEFALRSAAES